MGLSRAWVKFLMIPLDAKSYRILWNSAKFCIFRFDFILTQFSNLQISQWNLPIYVNCFYSLQHQYLILLGVKILLGLLHRKDLKKPFFFFFTTYYALSMPFPPKTNPTSNRSLTGKS